MSRILPLFLGLTLAAGAQSRPNIIFFFTDDLGYGDLGCFWQDQRTASKKFDTPALDIMAAEGAKLTHHYVAASVCAPSRASLLQGRHQGHCDVRDSQFDKALPDNHTIASVLQAAGYRTVHIGKGGLSGTEGSVSSLAGTGSQNLAAHPLDRGFDRFFGYLFHSDGHEHYPRNGTTGKTAHIYDDYQQITNASLDLYTTDAWTAAAKKEIIDEATDGDDQPFFIYLSYDAPHFNMQRPAVAYPALDTDGNPLTGGIQWTTATDGSGRVRYASTADGTGTVDGFTHPDIPSGWAISEKQHVGMIRRIDESVADILRTLQDLGIDNNTLCIFSSDHGPHDEGNNPRTFESYANMEGIKRDMWEGGIRVPTIVRWPGNIAGATGNPSSIHEIDYAGGLWDWMPTLCDLAGVPAPAWCDGVSLLPTLTGTGTQRDKGYLYFEFENGGSTPNWSEFPNHGGDAKGEMQCLRIGDHMGVRTAISTGNENFRIYDVTSDPGQAADLAASLPGLQAKMQALALTSRRPDASASRPYDGLPLTPAPPATPTPGVNWSSYVDSGATWQWVPEFRDLTAGASGTTGVPDVSVRPADDNFGLLFSGWIEIPTAGNYTFYLDSDTGADFFLHDGHLIADDFNHTGSANSGVVNLAAGLHPFRLHYRHATGTRNLALDWSGPGFARQAIPSSAFLIDGSLPPGPPTANDDGATTTIGTSILIDVLANDTDDGTPAPLSIQSVATPDFGTAVVEAGQIRYTPPAAFEGTAMFDYTITDGTDTDVATVTVEVVAQMPPVAVDDEATTLGNSSTSGTPVLIPVLANDSDPDGGPQPLSIQTVGSPEGGSATISGDQISYTPSAGFFGMDNFSYAVSDGAGSVSAWISVRVDPTPTANMTALWKLDGNATEQVSGTAGTLNGSAATNGTPIAPGSTNSLSLPSSGSHLDTNTNGGLGGTGSFTVLAFINTTTTTNAAILDYSPTAGVSGGADLRLFVQGTGDLRIEMSAGAGFNLSAAGDLGDGNNHMVAAVFNSATGDSFQDVDLYIDGTFYNVTGGTDHTINLVGTGGIFIGRDFLNAANRAFVGRIDDVAIYDEPLSLGELDQIRVKGVAPDLKLFSLWIADPNFGIHPSLRSFAADADSDGLANGVEAWFGTHPGEFSQGFSGLSTDGTVSVFTHPLNQDPPEDLSAAYEWSMNLSQWHAGDGIDGPVGGPTVDIDAVPSGSTATVTATASEPMGQLFLRLNVMRD